MKSAAPAARGVARLFNEYEFVPREAGPPASSTGDMDRAVERVREGSEVFSRLSLRERIDLIASMRRGVFKAAAPSVAAACRAKGITPGSPLEGEEWATGPVPVLRQLRLLAEALEALDGTGSTPVGPVSTVDDGRLAVQLFPTHRIDGILMRGVTVEARMEEGVDEGLLDGRRASFYRGAGKKGSVVLVLGGGNVAAIPPMDVLSKLFVEGKACLLKMNPVNSYLGPFIAEAFGEAVRRGFLAVLYGGPEEGSYLCRHAGVDEVHLTGSNKTHDAIVWGPPGPEQDRRKREGESRLGKELTSELGNVSPVIVVPGPYSERDLRYQAEDLAGAAVMNGSFLCNTPKVIVGARGWDGMSRFLRHLEEALARLPTRLAYYPGAADRWRLLTEGRKHLRTYGGARDGRLPWALVEEIDPAGEGDPLFAEEVFTPVIAETEIGSEDPVEFLDEAVSFVNDRLWGTLSATVVVHPRLLRDRGTAKEVERAIARLRYGTVAVNTFPGLSFALASPPWGGYPGAGDDDIQSGRGWVHNTSMLEGVEKVVVRHPLRTWPRPVWHPRQRNLKALMRRLALLEKDYRWERLPAVVLASLQ